MGESISRLELFPTLSTEVPEENFFKEILLFAVKLSETVRLLWPCRYPSLHHLPGERFRVYLEEGLVHENDGKLK